MGGGRLPKLGSHSVDLSPDPGQTRGSQDIRMETLVPVLELLYTLRLEHHMEKREFDWESVNRNGTSALPRTGWELLGKALHLWTSMSSSVK